MVSGRARRIFALLKYAIPGVSVLQHWLLRSRLQLKFHCDFFLTAKSYFKSLLEEEMEKRDEIFENEEFIALLIYFIKML